MGEDVGLATPRSHLQVSGLVRPSCPEAMGTGMFQSLFLEPQTVELRRTPVTPSAFSTVCIHLEWALLECLFMGVNRQEESYTE